MRVLSSSFIDAISNRFPGFVLAIGLSLLLASCSLTGSAESDVPEDVQIAVKTLGNNTPVMAGLRVSDALRSFLDGIQEPGPFQHDDSDMEFWTRLGIDLDNDDISVFLTADPATLSEGPNIVLFAPTDPEKTHNLNENWAAAEKLGDSPPSFQVEAGGRSTFLSIPEEGTVFVTPSEEKLTLMLSSYNNQSASGSLGDDYFLNQLASEQAWIIIRDVQGFLAELPIDRIPQQARGLIRAVSTAGFSANIVTNRVDLIGLIDPTEGVSAEDLAALIDGMVAMVKLSEDVPAAFTKIVETVSVSVESDRVRIRLHATADDLNTIASSFTDK